MSKIGVGVGDEFPLDDGTSHSNTTNNAPGDAPRDDRAEFEDWKRRRDAHRAQHEAWRAQREEWRRRRDEWKAQWREQRRAWRDEYRGAYPGDGDPAYPFSHWGRGFRRGRFPFSLARALTVVAAVALLIFAFSHIGVILVGLVAIGALFAAYHHFGHDPLDVGYYDRRDYARPVNNPPPAPTQAVEKPADGNANNNNGSPA